MTSSDEFQLYLEEVCHRYDHWWDIDGLTETIAARQATFSFEQMTQTEEKDLKGKSQKNPPLPIFQAIQNYIEFEHILLVGSPGIGKSTVLLRCLVKLAERERQKLNPRIPVLISLKRYNSSRFSSPEDPSGILTLIKDTLEPNLWLEVADIKKLLFKDRRLILLLDGLNEMSAGEKRTELEEFCRKCARSKVPLICSTRELSSGDLGIKRRLEIQPLRDPEINRFVQECIPDKKQKVLQLLNRDNRELSRTPFVLWMLYDLFQEQGIEVETLGEAFRRFFQSFKKYKEDASVSEERRRNWNYWLEYLAFKMLSSPDPQNPGLVITKEQAENLLFERFGELYGTPSRIEELCKYHLLEPISDREISFHHQLIQEYYAAEYLLTKLPTILQKQTDQKYTSFQMQHLNHLKWTEVIALMLGFIEVSDKEALQIIHSALSVDLILGSRLAGDVRIEIQKKTLELVDDAQLAYEPRSSDWLKVELLGQTRSRFVLPELQQFLRSLDISVARRASAWIGFLGYQEAKPYLLQMLSEMERWIPNNDGSRTFSDRTLSLEIEIIEALGKLSPKDATLKLREIFHDPASFIYSFSQPKIHKLLIDFDLETVKKESLESVKTSKNPNQISQASDLLSRLGCPEAALELISRLNCEQDADIYLDLIDALSLFDTAESISALVSLTASQDSSIREKAAKALIKYERVNAIDELLCHLEHSDWNIQWCAAVVLGKLNSDAALPVLLNGLTSRHPRYIRRTAAEVLGMIENDEVIDILLSALKDPDYAVRRSAAISLAHFDRKEAIEELLKALRHYYPLDDSCIDVEIEFKLDEYYTHIIRGMTHEMLMQLGDEEAIRAWAFEHSSTDIREQVAEALGRFNIEEVINGLLRALRKGVKVAALPLGRFGKQEVVPELLELLQNNQVSSSNKVIGTLAHLISVGNLSVVSELISILENIADYRNADFYFRNRVAITLAKVEHSEMPRYLSDLGRLLSTEVGEQALLAIAAIQSRCGFYNYEIAQQVEVKGKEPNGFSKQDEYERILSTLQNMALVMERNPETFHSIGEEALRDHFLVQLNGIYEGQATGETFNRRGKTDIIVRLRGENIFIGECKFWGGEIKLRETLDQLLSYSTVRDDQLGMLIFNRNKNISAVLKQIPSIIKGHSSFQQELDHSGTQFRFTLKHPDEPKYSLYLAVLVFDVPSIS